MSREKSSTHIQKKESSGKSSTHFFFVSRAPVETGPELYSLFLLPVHFPFSLILERNTELVAKFPLKSPAINVGTRNIQIGGRGANFGKLVGFGVLLGFCSPGRARTIVGTHTIAFKDKIGRAHV